MQAKEEQPKLTAWFLYTDISSPPSRAKTSCHGCCRGDICGRCAFPPTLVILLLISVVWLHATETTLSWLVIKKFIEKGIMYFRELEETFPNNQTSCIWFWFLCCFGPKFKFRKERHYVVKLKLPNQPLVGTWKCSLFRELNTVVVGWLFDGELRHC